MKRCLNLLFQHARFLLSPLFCGYFNPNVRINKVVNKHSSHSPQATFFQKSFSQNSKSQLEISSILNFYRFTWKYSLVFKIMLEKLTKKTPSVFCIFIKVNIHENIQSYLYIHFNAISPNLHLKTVFMFFIVFFSEIDCTSFQIVWHTFIIWERKYSNKNINTNSDNYSYLISSCAEEFHRKTVLNY